MSLHRVLSRQLRSLGCEVTVPPDSTLWCEFLRRVSASYEAADQDRYTIERSLEISSKEMRELHEKLTREADLAREAARAKSEFLANMSHEIRTPLTAIQGFSELLLLAELDEEEQRHYAEIIQRSCGHLIEVINDILDISKIESGKLQVELLPVDLRELASDLEQSFRLMCDAKGVELRVCVDHAVPRVLETDPTCVRQILTNLIGNAIKFTERGHVALRLGGDKSGTDSFRLVLEVGDTGIGMDAQQQQQVFDAFAQADSSTTRKFGGTGLGLTISRRLCEILGGGIGVESVPGEGSVFTASLMTGVVAQVADPVEKPKVEVAVPPGLEVLVVDDGPDNQTLLRRLLERAGVYVSVACNGREGVEKALTHGPFDVILMDMQMPEVDGYSATRALRRRGYSRAIIAVTAHALEHDRDICLQSGCDDYLSKPISKAALYEAISKATAASAVYCGESEVAG